MPSKAELLEENLRLIKNSIKGWANQIRLINSYSLNQDQMIVATMGLLEEMDNISGKWPSQK